MVFWPIIFIIVIYASFLYLGRFFSRHPSHKKDKNMAVNRGVKMEKPYISKKQKAEIQAKLEEEKRLKEEAKQKEKERLIEEERLKEEAYNLRIKNSPLRRDGPLLTYKEVKALMKRQW